GSNESLRHSKTAETSETILYADDERITDHLNTHLGGGMVFHEIVSERFHNDVHIVPPSDRYPFNILVTSGMSALPMNIPDGMADRDNWSHAELCLLLPPDWPLDTDSFSDERHYWPIRLLKDLARLPHDYSTWLGWGHTVPNGDPAAAYAEGTELSAAMIIPPFILGTEFFAIEGKPPIIAAMEQWGNGYKKKNVINNRSGG
ncbi:MAG: suppressor of fused domain protein, partial [Spirochaetota bacterium]